jgi:septal ring factor EnvC (AmiA/AmiB activator)
MTKQNHSGNSGGPRANKSPGAFSQNAPFDKGTLQKELLEKVKPGTKPSDLKRSKSAENLLTPPAPPLARSKSAEPFSDPKYPYTTLISQAQELETLRKESETKSTTIALLRKKVEELESSLSSLTKGRQSLETELEQVRIIFTEQLTQLAKLQSLEAENQTLKEQIATLTNHVADLDLEARHQNLKA